MDLRFDPRGDLPPPIIQPTSYYSRRNSNMVNNDQKRLSKYDWISSKPKDRPCHDWILSSASNIHIAIDLSAYKTYTPFKSYVLAVADQRKIPVYGIGEVELKIRRHPEGKENNTICLENVLHVPNWLCNVLSDAYFVPARDFEHTWSSSGVSFQKKESGNLKPWGYTETFCGLDRIVLARKHKGRSPMLEDKDREVFSINVTWPQSQRDRWELHVATKPTKDDVGNREDNKSKRKSIPREGKSELSDSVNSAQSLKVIDNAKARPRLTEIPVNINRSGKVPTFRTNSLKAYPNSRSPLKIHLAWRKSSDH